MSGDMRTWATMGDNAQTWRVVDDRGEAHEVTISPARWPGQWYVTATGRLRTVAASTARSAAATVAAMHFAVAEIRGPGEKTTAEQLEALRAERDALEAALRDVALTCGRCRSRHATGLANIGGAYDELCDNCAGHRDVQSFAPSDHADVLRSLDAPQFTAEDIARHRAIADRILREER